MWIQSVSDSVALYFACVCCVLLAALVSNLFRIRFRFYSSKDEIYRHLSIDIVSNEDENIKSTVEQSLKQFFQPETREIKCEKCKDGVDAQQTIQILSRYVCSLRTSQSSRVDASFGLAFHWSLTQLLFTFFYLRAIQPKRALVAPETIHCRRALDEYARQRKQSAQQPQCSTAGLRTRL